MNSFSALRRDLVDLLMRYGADPLLCDKHGLFPFDYANPLVSAWIQGAIYPPASEIYGTVPTLKHMALTSLRSRYTKLRETDAGRFLVTLADLDEKLLWSFVKPPIAIFRWIDAISDAEPKKMLLGNLIYRKLSLWDHESASLPSCYRLRMAGRPHRLGAHAPASSFSLDTACGCTISTMIRFRDTGMSGQLYVVLDMTNATLSLQYGATGRDLLKYPQLLSNYLQGLGLDPQTDVLILILICISALPSIFIHFGTYFFQEIFEVCKKVSRIECAPSAWFTDALELIDRNRLLPLYLPPVAKRDNGVLITDSATFELSSGKIQFVEPPLESRSSRDSGESSGSNFDDSSFSDNSTSS